MENIASKVIFLSLALVLSGCTEFKSFVRSLPRIEQTHSYKKAAFPDKEPAENIYTGEVLGELEKVLIQDADIPPLDAKLNPDADITVMSAEILHTFKKGGEEFAVFHLPSKNSPNKEFTKKIVRWDTHDKSRPVVLMDICLGNKRIRGEVSLAADGHLLYPIIIGNNILKDAVIIDKSKQYTLAPRCL